MLDPILPDSSHREVRWGQLYGAAASLAMAEAAARADRPLLVIAADTREAERLHGELAFFAGDQLGVRLFPDWETLPYDLFAPHPDIVSERLATLHALPQLRRGIVVVALPTLLQRLPPRAWIDAHTFELVRGTELDVEGFRGRLVAAGYAHVGQVETHGEFAVRGSLIDVFPMGTDRPVRIDLFGTEIDSIRAFDPESQRSGHPVERLRLLPAREFPLSADGVRDFRGRFRARFEGDPARSPLYRQVSDGLAPAGIEYYLPLFFSELATLFDYLPANTLLVDTADSATRASVLWQDIVERYEQRRHDAERPLLSPPEIFLTPEELHERVGRADRVALGRVKLEAAGTDPNVMNFPTHAPPRLRVDPRAAEPAAALVHFLRDFEGRVLLAAESTG